VYDDAVAERRYQDSDPDWNHYQERCRSHSPVAGKADPQDVEEGVHPNQACIDQEELRIWRCIMDPERYKEADQTDSALDDGKYRQEGKGESKPTTTLVIPVDRALCR
jgi:hypothetical protein